MKLFKIYPLLIITLFFIHACGDKKIIEEKKTEAAYTAAQYNNTKGYDETGKIISKFYCPDAKNMFPPIDIKFWDKVPVVNGRLPTYEETMNGTSIHHYGEKESRIVKPYYLTLPKLARFLYPSSNSLNTPMKCDDLVVVIQIVQTPEDTIVGYRFLSGGVGGSNIRDFHFLTDEEVREVVQR